MIGRRWGRRRGRQVGSCGMLLLTNLLADWRGRQRDAKCPRGEEKLLAFAVPNQEEMKLCRRS